MEKKEKETRGRYGDGYIKERSPGHFRIIIPGIPRDDKERSQVRKTVVGSKRDAVREKRRLQLEVERGTYVEPVKLTVGDLLDDYHARYVVLNNVPRSAQTFKYNIDSNIKPSLGSVALSSLTWQQVEDFRDGLLAGMQAISVNNNLGLLRRALRWGVKRELVAVNVCEKVDNLPTSKKKKTVDYSLVNFKKVRDVFSGTDLELAVTIALHTGLRIGEVLGLWWNDIDFENGRIAVRRGLAHVNKVGHYWGLPKTATSVRVLPMKAGLRRVLEERWRNLEDELGAEKLKELLKDARRRLDEADSDNCFFATKFVPEQVCAFADDRRLLNQSTFSSRFRRGLEAAGMPGIVVHDLRHHFASAMEHLGVRKRTTSQLMGHTNSTMTDGVYIHDLPEDLDRAMERLDDYLS